MNAFFKRNPITYYGFIGYKNLGDEAIWQATKNIFSPIQLHLFPESRFAFINNLVKFKHKKIAILGGGTLIGDNSPTGRNLFRERYYLQASNSEHSIAFGTGVGAIDLSKGNTWLIQWKPILEQCSYIGVRGPLSVEVLANIGIKSEIIGDPACSWVQDTAFYTPKEKKIGICIGCTQRYFLHDKMKILGDVLFNKQKEGWSIEFFIINPGDFMLTKQFIKKSRLTHNGIHTIYENTQLYLDAVKHMKLFAGTRLHSVILAMCAGVPSLMIEYAPKNYEFMLSVGMEKYSITMTEITETLLNEMLDSINDESEDISKYIIDVFNDYRKLQHKTARSIISKYL